MILIKQERKGRLREKKEEIRYGKIRQGQRYTVCQIQQTG